MMTERLAPERATDDVVVMLPDRQWELFDGQTETSPSNAHDDTRQFVLQKLQAITEAAKNPLIAPAASRRTKPRTTRPAAAQRPEPVEAEAAKPFATEPESVPCPVTIAATEAVADAPVYTGFGPSPEVAEHLRQFRRQQNRVTALVFGAVACAGLATIGGIAFVLV